MLEKVYDDLAIGHDGSVEYDEMYQSARHKTEDRHLFSHIEGWVGRAGSHSKILDVGCGTGLLPDSMEIQGDYLGVDPSENSIDVAQAKHPKLKFRVQSAEAFFKRGVRKNGKFSAVLALYGVGSYIDPEYYRALLEHTDEYGLCLAMFYLPDYSPAYYTPEMTRVVHDNIDYGRIIQTFPHVKRWAGKYLVASNKGLSGLEEV